MSNYQEDFAQWLYSQLLNGAMLGPSSVEALAASLLCDCFAMARVGGAHASYFPVDVVETIAEELVMYGDSIWRVGPGRLEWIGADHYSTNRQGQYWVNGRPTSPSNIFHVRYRVDRLTGRGVSPLASSKMFRDLTRNIDKRLQEESRIAVSHVLPVPQVGDVPKVDADGNPISGETESAVVQLTRRVRKMAARLYAVTSFRMLSEQMDPNEYKPIRWGPQYTPEMLQAADRVRRMASAIYGLPQALIEQDGSGLREGLRYYLHTTLQPYGKRITAAAELARLEVNFDFTDIMAADIQGRARAFESIVNRDDKLTREEAMALVGFEEIE